MQIKVCGLKDERNIMETADLEPDFMGFIYYDKSPRYAGNTNKKIYAKIDKKIKKTAVFVNESVENILSVVNENNFECVQLHGEENESFCEKLKKIMPQLLIIKAVSVSFSSDVARAQFYQNSCDYILFDTKSKMYGGSGLKFNHSLLADYNCILPYFLSGGIDMEHIESDRKTSSVHSKFFGYDLNSKFEISAGVKNIDMLRQAFKLLKNE